VNLAWSVANIEMDVSFIESQSSEQKDRLRRGKGKLDYRLSSAFATTLNPEETLRRFRASR